MRASQDRNESFAGQKWKLGRTDMGAWQDRKENLSSGWFGKHNILPVFLSFLSVFCHFWLLSATYSSFSSIFALFSAIYLAFLPICRTVWKSSLAQQFGRTELQNLAPPDRKIFWQERIEFWQDRVVGPPLKMTQLRLCCLQKLMRWWKQLSN